MLVKKTSVESIRRILTQGFTVRDIAEPLVSFDSTTDSAEVLEFLRSEDFDCAGVRKNGLVVGSIHRDDLQSGCCAEQMKPIVEDDLVGDFASLADVVKKLVEHPRVFVSMLGSVVGIVTRQDLAKPPIRMWLFGMISIVELRFVRLISTRFPDGEWCELLSAGRMEKAKQLHAERNRRNKKVNLLDCLQLSDKGTIIARDVELREIMQFESRRRVEDLLKKLESLRNNLAHSQDIVESDWDTIVLLSENLDRVIEGPPERPGLLEV